MFAQRPGQAPHVITSKSAVVTIPRGLYRLLIAGTVAGFAVLGLGFLVALGVAVGHQGGQQPASDTKQVASFNDGWDTGLQDVQQMWQGDRARVGQCLNTAQPAQLHTCLSNTK